MRSAFDRGVDAWDDGFAIDENPFNPNTHHKDWEDFIDGWLAAENGDAEALFE